MTARIQPLCDKDHTAMLAQIVRVATESGAVTFQAYGCDTLDCHRCYTESMGYFDFVASRTHISDRQTICDTDACPMYLESASPGEDHVWKRPCCGQRERY